MYQTLGERLLEALAYGNLRGDTLSDIERNKLDSFVKQGTVLYRDGVYTRIGKSASQLYQEEIDRLYWKGL